MVDRLSFDEWGDRLCARFFASENAGRPVTLFIDDEVLAEVTGTDPGEAVADLAAAVRSRMGPGTGNMFYPVLRDASIWKSAGGVGCPPFLPLLALGVLAAAHMAREGDVAAHNYYWRFRDLIGLDGSGMPRGYDETFPTLWNWLTWWLNEVKMGSLGVSTVHAHSWLTNTGYALSQALLRESDRQRMTHFFYWLDLEPGERLTEQELLQYFRVWARKYRRVGEGMLRMVGDPRGPRGPAHWRMRDRRRQVRGSVRLDRRAGGVERGTVRGARLADGEGPRRRERARLRGRQGEGAEGSRTAGALPRAGVSRRPTPAESHLTVEP
jgi:hypothetical protein